MLKCIQGFFAVQPSIGCPEKFLNKNLENLQTKKIARKKTREIVFA